MPTYSYACKECAHAFDVHQDFSDAALTQCPECGGPLRKLFGRVGVVFKGSGFYRTDSRGGASSVPAKSGSEKVKDITGGKDVKPAEASAGKASESTPSTPPAAAAS